MAQRGDADQEKEIAQRGVAAEVAPGKAALYRLIYWTGSGYLAGAMA